MKSQINRIWLAARKPIVYNMGIRYYGKGRISLKSSNLK
jgi:hypothetical protein